MIKQEIELLYKRLNIVCDNCFGLCCIGLYFSKVDGFPEDKKAGVPCKHLNNNYKCDIHSDLFTKNLRGCMNYECFGAGQFVSTYTFLNTNGCNNNDNLIFDCFNKIKYLHEMIWYLLEAYELSEEHYLKKNIENEINYIIALCNYDKFDLLTIDIELIRNDVNILLRQISDIVFKKHGSKNILSGRECIGKNFNNTELRGADCRGSLLIAADLSNKDLSYTNFQAADMRDANISNSDLSKSLFLTQSQINSCIGNDCTILPSKLKKPTVW